MHITSTALSPNNRIIRHVYCPECGERIRLLLPIRAKEGAGTVCVHIRCTNRQCLHSRQGEEVEICLSFSAGA